MLTNTKTRYTAVHYSMTKGGKVSSNLQCHWYRALFKCHKRRIRRDEQLFGKEIIQFQEREGTVVNIAQVLKPRCLAHIKTSYHLDSSDIMDMSMSVFFWIVSQECNVGSTMQFYQQLKNALADKKLMSWYEVSPDNHEEYYFQQVE